MLTGLEPVGASSFSKGKPKMKIQLPRYEVKIIKRNDVQQRVGSFNDRDKAVEYGEKYYARRYVIVDREAGEVSK